MQLPTRLALSALLLTSACASTKAECPEPAVLPSAETNFVNAISVMSVKDHAAALTWYSKLLGRQPDVEPAEGVAEWQLVGEAWLQVGLDPDHAGQTTVVVGVKDLVAQRTACETAGIALGETQDYGVVLLAEAVDPDGNKVAFVQQVGGG